MPLKTVHEISSNVADYAGSVGEKASHMLKSGRGKLEMLTGSVGAAKEIDHITFAGDKALLFA